MTAILHGGFNGPSNRWTLTSDPTAWMPGTVRVIDAAVPEPYVLPLLLQHNCDDVRTLFRVDPSFLRDIRERMYSIGTVEQRQLQALLINHHAVIDHEDGLVQLYGNSAERPAGHDRWGVGATRPLLWVLGERANPNARSFPLPFGTAMGRDMLWPHYRPWLTRLSNAIQPDEGRETQARIGYRLERDWEAMGEPLVLLLGRTAAALWGTRRNVIGYLDHPQHVYRFYHQHRNQWSSDFADLQTLAAESTTAGIGCL